MVRSALGSWSRGFCPIVEEVTSAAFEAWKELLCGVILLLRCHRGHGGPNALFTGVLITTTIVLKLHADFIS